MPSFIEAFSPLGPQQALWLFLGLDHVQRGRLRQAWRYFDRNLYNATPTFLVMIGVAVQNEPYISFFDRARRRLEDWYNDRDHFRPPVGPRGYAVFLAWDRITGRVRNEPFEDVVDPLGGRVWVSPNWTTPRRTAIADARYWRGDLVAMWGQEFPDSRVWPRIINYPVFIPGSLGHNHFPGIFPAPLPPAPDWVFGEMPAPIRAGLRGEPARAMPPDPRH